MNSQHKLSFSPLPNLNPIKEEKQSNSKVIIHGSACIDSNNTEYSTDSLKVPQVTPNSSEIYSNKNPETTFVVPDDGLGFDDGVRVLRTLGTWLVIYT